MLCAISGEAPQEPVASKQSGNIFEKRLIEAYVAENHKDPVSGEELDSSDLIPLQTSRVVKPRPPTLTSIPSLLSSFQNEWDALMLETYTLNQNFNQLKQELSTALYENDAAVRVIARLTKERNEAREALGKMSVGQVKSMPTSTATTVNGESGESEAMQVDSVPAVLPDEYVQKIDDLHASLSQGRRKRPVPENWTSAETLQSFEVKPGGSKILPPGSHTLAVDTKVDKGGVQALIGGTDGTVMVYNFQKDSITRTLEAGEASINDGLCVDYSAKMRSAIACGTGEVKLFDGESLVATFRDHAGSANGLALHPGRQIMASIGDDKSIVLYDAMKKVKLTQFSTDHSLNTCAFHPDGHFIAVGSADGTVSIFTLKSASKEHTFEFQSPIQALSFSENGSWLAVATQGSSTVEIVTLTKMNTVHRLDFGSAVNTIEWDYTGQYLAAGGGGFVGVQVYDKGAKTWSYPLTKALGVTKLHWGPSAKGLVVMTTQGSIQTVR